MVGVAGGGEPRVEEQTGRCRNDRVGAADLRPAAPSPAPDTCRPCRSTSAGTGGVLSVLALNREVGISRRPRPDVSIT